MLQILLFSELCRLCASAGHWRSWIPRGSQCWTGIPLGQTHLWTCKMGSLQCCFKGQPARFVWQHWGWLPASRDLCGTGLRPNTDNADWKGLGKVYPNTANTEPLMLIFLLQKRNLVGKLVTYSMIFIRNFNNFKANLHPCGNQTSVGVRLACCSD